MNEDTILELFLNINSEYIKSTEWNNGLLNYAQKQLHKLLSVVPPISLHPIPPASLWLVCFLPITLALQPGLNTTRSPPAPSSKHQTRPLHWTNWSLIPMREPGFLGIMGLHTTPCPCLTHLGHEKGAAGLRVFSRPSADGWLDAQSRSLVVWHTWQVCESLRGNLILPAINSSFGLILGSKYVYLWEKLNNCNWQINTFHRIFIKTQHLRQLYLFISKTFLNCSKQNTLNIC